MWLTLLAIESGKTLVDPADPSANTAIFGRAAASLGRPLVCSLGYSNSDQQHT